MLPVLVQVRDSAVTHGPSSWIILSRSPPFLSDRTAQKRGLPWIPRRKVIWTDSFSNLLQILRW